MKLNLTDPYLVLQPFSIDFPEFTILTGINGSGKSIFLNAVQSQIIKNNYTDQVNLIKLFNNNSFQLQLPHISKDEAISNYLDFYQEYNDYRENLDNNRISVSHYMENVAENIAILAGKNKSELSQDDFKKYAPVHLNFPKSGIFNLNFFWICYYYSLKVEQNTYNAYLNNIRGKIHIHYLSDEEFNKIHGEAPWDYVNKIFNNLNIDYEIQTTDINEPYSHFELFFINMKTGLKINYSDLSTGEQVIILTAITIYSIQYNEQNPKLLLMDEPDASLHPSMIKYFLKVIEEVFVKEKGMKVILTTHNPTTVALAPEGSIYSMSKSKNIPERTNKDKALKILTEGVPSFSVNYENRRQVFVESPYDVKYYERLYVIFSSKLDPVVSLNFIASGDVQKNEHGLGKNSCDVVKEITTLMRNSGNNFIYGIIDWDREVVKPASEFVFVLGWEKRYSIENYLFDPLLVAALMLREKYIKRDDIGLSPDETYIDFRFFDTTKLQLISDYIVEKLNPYLNDEVALSNNEYTEVQLINGKRINLPNWFLLHQGHKLEEAYINAFDNLKKSKKNKEELLKLEIIDKVIDDIPEVLSVDILDLLRNLQQ